MTSQEIKDRIVKAESAGSTEEARWLREIAYQLAVQNESRAKKSRPDPTEGKYARSAPPPLPADMLPSPFPKVAEEGDGRWGVWFGPGPSLRSFDTEDEARSFLLSLADKMNRHDPHPQGAQSPEPAPERGSVKTKAQPWDPRDAADSERGTSEDMRGKVRIYSDEHGAYWRPDGKGYTSDESRAGIWLFSDALARTAHCGPEKRIVFQDISTGKFWNPKNPQGARPSEPVPAESSQTKEEASQTIRNFMQTAQSCLSEPRCNAFRVKPPGGQCELKFGHEGPHEYVNIEQTK